LVRQRPVRTADQPSRIVGSEYGSIAFPSRCVVAVAHHLTSDIRRSFGTVAGSPLLCQEVAPEWVLWERHVQVLL
jgi:hypothetical protein